MCCVCMCVCPRRESHLTPDVPRTCTDSPQDKEVKNVDVTDDFVSERKEVPRSMPS